MPISTRKSNAGVHPGRIVLGNQKARRTRQQIELDDARARAATNALIDEEEARNRRIAELEDKMESNEEQVRIYSNRPDLQVCDMPPMPPRGSNHLDETDHESDVYTPPASVSDGSSISDPSDEDQDNLNLPVDDLTLVPDVDPESHSLPVSDAPAYPKAKKTVKKGDLRVAVDALRTIPGPNGKRKASPEVSTGTQPTTGRRGTSPQGVREHKRLKRCNAIGGLNANWKSRVTPINQANQVPTQIYPKSKSQSWSNDSMDADHGHSLSLDYESEGRCSSPQAQRRPFDYDEPEDILERVKASKTGMMPGIASTASQAGAVTSESIRYTRLIPAPPIAGLGPISVARHTAQMRVKLMRIMGSSKPIHRHKATGTDHGVIELDNETPAGVSSHKQGHTKADLPFPPGGNHRHIWGKRFRPALLSWAGSQDDPFGTNGRMYDEIHCIWSRLFPDIELDDEKMKIVVDVCDCMLTSWRSEIGKHGIGIIEALWESNPRKYGHSEQRKVYATSNLKGLNYLYKFPARVIERGAFRSRLISEVFSSHLKKVLTEVHEYGYQVGALALVTVAVERGFELYRKTGEDIRKVEVQASPEVIQDEDKDEDSEATACQNKKGDKRRGTPRAYDFADSPWGARARDITRRCKGLNAESWESIIEHASRHLGSEEKEVLNGDAVDDGDDGDMFNLHANIDLD